MAYLKSVNVQELTLAKAQENLSTSQGENSHLVNYLAKRIQSVEFDFLSSKRVELRDFNQVSSFFEKLK